MILCTSSSYRQFSMSALANIFNTSVIRTVLILLSASRIILSIPVPDDYSVELTSTSTITYTSPAPEDFSTKLQNDQVCEYVQREICIAYLQAHINEDSTEFGQLEILKDSSFRVESSLLPLPIEATISGFTELIKLLLRNGVPINKKYSFGGTVLHIVPDCGFGGLATFHPRPTIDIQINDWAGDTLLHTAVSHYQSKTAKLLLDAGADVNATNRLGETPLFRAVKYITPSEYLPEEFNSEHDPEYKNWRYSMAKDIIKLLLEHGADTTIANHLRITPLHVAAKNSNVAIVRLLIDEGANVNAVDINNKTPLHSATESNNVSVVEYLLTMGCDKTIADSGNKTALDIAVENNFTEIVKILSKES